MADILHILSYLLVVAAGISVALQQILNSNLRSALDSPWWAGFVSYAVGMLAMLVMALAAPGRRLKLDAIGNTSCMAWTGGLFGAVFIGVAVIMVPRLGAATVLALIVVGQMVGSITFDHLGLFGLPPHPVSWQRLAGAVLLISGVTLIRS
jgi:transporter family-2 protein